MWPRADVDLRRVVEHRGLPGQAGEGADLFERVLWRLDEPLVPKLEVAPGPDTPAEGLRGPDLGTPLAGEVGDRLRVPPGLRHDPRRHLQEGRRGVTAVAHEVDVERVGEQPLEQAQVLHVHRRLVAPARLSPRRCVRLVDGADRLAGRHGGPEPGAYLLRVDLPLAHRPDAAQVVHERVDVDTAPMAVRELGDEVRLVGERELRVPVEHDPEERRSRAPDAEDEERWIRRAHAGAC